MKFLHYLTDQEGKQIESVYSNNPSKKLSLEVNAKIYDAKYQVWNRESNEVTTIEIKI